MPSSLPQAYIILDFETTGLEAPDSEIIEIGAIRVEGLEAQARFQALVRPEGRIPLVIQQLTGITPEMLEDKKPLHEVIPEFLEFIGDLPFVAHNSAMEQSFLDVHITPAAGRSFQVHNSIDPIGLILPDHSSHSMEALRKWSGVQTGNSHRALDDCEDLLKVLIYSQEWMRTQRPQVNTIVNTLLGKSSDWWWGWYFETDDSSSLSEALARPALGDLRELRAQDADRSVQENSFSISSKQVHEILTRPIADSKFHYRESQERMAQEVTNALNEGERIAVEAPTGTGKSVAYLLPALLGQAEMNTDTKIPLIVSTHSKALQDQLLEKDIPLVRQILQKPEIKAVAVKGQENYLCLRKLHDVAASLSEDAPLDERYGVAYLLSLSRVNTAAELDRVSHYLKLQFPALSSLMELVRSHYTTTRGPTCPYYRNCHFFDSARLAHQADVIIANHALTFHWPNHLPGIHNIVFDEAHHLEDQITDAHSIKLSEEVIATHLDHLSRKRKTRRSGDCIPISNLLRGLVLPDPFHDTNPTDLLADLTDTARNRLTQITSIIPLTLRRNRIDSDGYEEHLDLDHPHPAQAELQNAFEGLATVLGKLASYLNVAQGCCEGSRLQQDPAYDLLAAHAYRFAEYESQLNTLLKPKDKKEKDAGTETLRLLYWDPKENTWRFVISPIHAAKMAEDFFATKRSVILTSATLSTGSSATFITDRIGIQLSRPLISLPSPFRLEEQAITFIPNDISQPGTPGHLEALIGFTEQVSTLLGGRTLLLMTSNRRLRAAAETLREQLRPHGITVFDSLTDRRAAENFRVTERALLIGSERYGEGLDIPGKALSCVIIEKINESMTRGPLAEARKAKTKFALYDYDFPLRMIWLKQRVGRLIRSATDQGAIIVFDPRYHSWSGASRQHVHRALAPIPIQTGKREEILFQLDKIITE